MENWRGRLSFLASLSILLDVKVSGVADRRHGASCSTGTRMLTKQHIRFSETPGRNREPDGEQTGVTEEGNRLRGGYVRENE